MNSQQLNTIFERARLSGGFEKAARDAIFALNEENQDLKRAIVDLAEMFDRMVDNLQNMTTVVQATQSAVDSVKNQMRPDDGLNPSTMMIGKD